MDEVKDDELVYLVAAKKFAEWIEDALNTGTNIFDDPETENLLKAFSLVYPEQEVSGSKNIQRFFLIFCAGIKTGFDIALSIERESTT